MTLDYQYALHPDPMTLDYQYVLHPGPMTLDTEDSAWPVTIPRYNSLVVSHTKETNCHSDRPQHRFTQ